VTARAVIVGAVESTAVAVRALTRSGWDLPLVVTLPTDKAARHSDFVDLAPDAKVAGAQIFHTAQTNHPDTIAAIRAAQPDYIFVIGWSQICGREFLDITPGKVIGYHPAALPRLRGRAVIAWTILLDEKITAGSLFWIAEGVDDGPLLEQQFFHLAPRETASTLYTKHMAALDVMVARALPRLAAGDIASEIQDETCATYATRRKIIDGLIDWHRPAVEIDRLVRAASKPYPGAFTAAKDMKMIIWQSELIEPSMPYHAQPGQVVADNDQGLIVQTGSGQLRITDWYWELEGRPQMHSLLGRSHG
jgi:methionyl-tRNA formyltransferase